MKQFSEDEFFGVFLIIILVVCAMFLPDYQGDQAAPLAVNKEVTFTRDFIVDGYLIKCVETLDGLLTCFDVEDHISK